MNWLEEREEESTMIRWELDITHDDASDDTSDETSDGMTQSSSFF